MARHQEVLSLMQTPMPKNNREWQNFLVRLANMNFRSGLTHFDDSTNSGFFFGYDADGTPVVVIGDRSTGAYVEWDGTNLNLGPNVVQLT